MCVGAKERGREISKLQRDWRLKALPYMGTTVWRKEEVSSVGTEREHLKALLLYGRENKTVQAQARALSAGEGPFTSTLLLYTYFTITVHQSTTASNCIPLF